MCLKTGIFLPSKSFRTLHDNTQSQFGFTSLHSFSDMACFEGGTLKLQEAVFSFLVLCLKLQEAVFSC